MFDEEPDPDPHGECLEEITRLTNQRDHALADLKAEIANHREDLDRLQSLHERAEKAEQYAEDLIKDYAEWMSPEDYASLAGINVKLRTALERIRNEFDFSWDQGDPEPLRSIAKEALGNPPNFPF